MAARLTTYVVVAIVAATLIAGLMVGAQRDDSNGPVDLIVFNAKVYTADASGTMAEAVAVRGNQILRVGSDREIERLRRPQTVVVDAHGAAVVPGFNDGDVQFMKGALRLGGVDLLQIDSIVDAQAAISGMGRDESATALGMSGTAGRVSVSAPAGRRGNCSMPWYRTARVHGFRPMAVPLGEHEGAEACGYHPSHRRRLRAASSKETRAAKRPVF